MLKKQAFTLKTQMRLLVVGLCLTFPLLPIFPIVFLYFVPNITRMVGMGGYFVVFIGLWITQGLIHKAIKYKIANPY